MVQLTIEVVKAALDEKLGAAHACPMCGQDDWAINEAIMELRPWHGGPLVRDEPVTPAVMLFCKNCGDMHLFSLVRLGLLPPMSPAERMGLTLPGNPGQISGNGKH